MHDIIHLDVCSLLHRCVCRKILLHSVNGWNDKDISKHQRMHKHQET